MQLGIFEFWVKVSVNTMILSLAKTCGLKPIPKNPKIKNHKSKGPKFISQTLTLTKKQHVWVAYLGMHFRLFPS
jgi:hypothetical protein